MAPSSLFLLSLLSFSLSSLSFFFLVFYSSLSNPSFSLHLPLATTFLLERKKEEKKLRCKFCKSTSSSLSFFLFLLSVPPSKKKKSERNRERERERERFRRRHDFHRWVHLSTNPFVFIFFSAGGRVRKERDRKERKKRKRERKKEEREFLTTKKVTV